MDLSGVAVEVTAVPEGRVRRLSLRLEWHRTDPLAVRLRLCAEPDHPSQPGGSWTVLRDFLRYGLEEPTGDGEVRVEPCAEGLALTLARLSRPAPARVRVPSALVAAFLDVTETVVPSGAEAPGAAVDDLVDRLLRRQGDQGQP